MNKEIYILIDYRDQFYFSTRFRGASVRIDRLRKYFQDRGFLVIIKKFFEINLREENFKNKWVLYQSSEDPNLYYKDYIEDIIFGLYLQGARLIPDFHYFRAHHNKVFMEILRDLLPIAEIKNIFSMKFGTFEEYIRTSLPSSKETLLLKPGFGTRSQGIKLLNNQRRKMQYPLAASRTYTCANIKFLLSKLLTGKPYTPMSTHRHKFIIQNFIPNLTGDYRVLVYNNKYYVVFRSNRTNDFRASGSGKINFDINPPKGFLDYSKAVYTQLKVPFASLDIGYKDGNFYLFEFQCISLGQYTIEKSQFYYTVDDTNQWRKVFEKPDLEREICSSVLAHIEN